MAITPRILGLFERAWSQNDRTELGDAARHVSDGRVGAYFGSYGPKRVFAQPKTSLEPRCVKGFGSTCTNEV